MSFLLSRVRKLGPVKENKRSVATTGLNLTHLKMLFWLTAIWKLNVICKIELNSNICELINEFIENNTWRAKILSWHEHFSIHQTTWQSGARTSNVLAADWQNQTEVKNWHKFKRVLLLFFFSGLKIRVKHHSLKNKPKKSTKC